MPRFEHPYFFYLLWAIPVLLLLSAVYRRWRLRAIKKLGKAEQVGRMLPAQPAGRFWGRQLMLLLALVLLVVAAANPQRGAKKQQTRQQSSDVILALDISRSMQCADVAPNRLERAQYFTQNLVKALAGERIGLIFFAGNAFLQMPLSADYDAAIMYLKNADPGLLSTQGTAIPEAIKLARQSFDPDPGAGRALILITDGENHDDDAVAAAADAFDDGIIIYAVGAGTPEGGPIPIGPGAYKRDENNEIVRTKLNNALLREIADAGKGAVYNIRQGDAAIAAIKSDIGNLQKRELSVRSYSEYDSGFQYWLLPAIVLLFVLFFEWSSPFNKITS